LRAKALFISSYRPRSLRILSAGLSLIIIGEHKANLALYLCMTSMNSTPASDVEHLLRGGSAMERASDACDCASIGSTVQAFLFCDA